MMFTDADLYRAREAEPTATANKVARWDMSNEERVMPFASLAPGARDVKHLA
jgi:hypothetical protein